MKIKNCSECQQEIKHELNACQNWEIKRKEALNKIQEEDCLSDTLSAWDFQQQGGHIGKIQKLLEKYRVSLDNLETARACSKCEKVYQRNFYGDETGEKAFADANYYRNHNCQSQQDNSSPAPSSTQNFLYCRQCGKKSDKKYFCASGCGRSQINNSPRDDYDKEVEANYISPNNWKNKQQELSRKYGGFIMGIDYCNYCGLKYDKIAHTQEPLYINHDCQSCKQQRNVNIERERESNGNSKDFNWTPWIIGVGIVLLLIGIVAYFLIKKKRK